MRRIACLILVLTLLVPALAAQETTDPAVEARVQELTKKVEELRHLTFESKVKVGIMNKERLAAFLAEEIDREMPAEEMEAARVSLVAFGLLPDGQDLRAILLEILSGDIAGFYNPRTKELYLISEDDPSKLSEALAANEEVWVHELTHAVDDQHFDLLAMDKKVEEHDDQATAVQMLTEGVATYTMFLPQLQGAQGPAEDVVVEVMRGVLRLSEWTAQQEETGTSPELKRFKDFYTSLMIAPYRDGFAFARALAASGGWEAVDRVYANPPRSTEQVLHPEKYLAGEEPVEVALPDVAKELGGAYRLAETNHLGELQTRLILRHHLESSALAEGIYDGLFRFARGKDGLLGDLYEKVVRPLSVVEMAAGWAGDTYRVYSVEGGHPALVWRTAWDSGRDAREFTDAILKVLRSSGEVTEVEAGWLWRCERGGLCYGVHEGEDRVDVFGAIPPDRWDAVLEAVK